MRASARTERRLFNALIVLQNHDRNVTRQSRQCEGFTGLKPGFRTLQDATCPYQSPDPWRNVHADHEPSWKRGIDRAVPRSDGTPGQTRWRHPSIVQMPEMQAKPCRVWPPTSRAWHFALWLPLRRLCSSTQGVVRQGLPLTTPRSNRTVIKRQRVRNTVRGVGRSSLQRNLPPSAAQQGGQSLIEVRAPA